MSPNALINTETLHRRAVNLAMVSLRSTVALARHPYPVQCGTIVRDLLDAKGKIIGVRVCTLEWGHEGVCP